MTPHQRLEFHWSGMKPDYGAWVRGVWKRPHLERVTSPYPWPVSVCLYIWREGISSVRTAPSLPPVLSFPWRLGPLLLFPEVSPNPSQKRKLFWRGQGRGKGNEQLSVCWSSFQILRSSPFHNFLPRRNPRERGGRGQGAATQGPGLWFCSGSWAQLHPFCSHSSLWYKSLCNFGVRKYKISKYWLSWTV